MRCYLADFIEARQSIYAPGFLNHHNEGLEKELNDLKLKKPRTVIKVNTVAEIKEVEVLIDVPCEDFNLPFEVDSSYYHIKGLLTNKALKFNSVTIPNEQAIYVADLRKKWWKKKEYSRSSSSCRDCFRPESRAGRAHPS